MQTSGINYKQNGSTDSTIWYACVHMPRFWVGLSYEQQKTSSFGVGRKSLVYFSTDLQYRQIREQKLRIYHIKHRTEIKLQEQRAISLTFFTKMITINFTQSSLHKVAPSLRWLKRGQVFKSWGMREKLFECCGFRDLGQWRSVVEWSIWFQFISRFSLFNHNSFTFP